MQMIVSAAALNGYPAMLYPKSHENDPYQTPDTFSRSMKQIVGCGSYFNQLCSGSRNNMNAHNSAYFYQYTSFEFTPEGKLSIDPGLKENANKYTSCVRLSSGNPGSMFRNGNCVSTADVYTWQIEFVPGDYFLLKAVSRNSGVEPSPPNNLAGKCISTGGTGTASKNIEIDTCPDTSALTSDDDKFLWLTRDETMRPSSDDVQLYKWTPSLA